MGNTFHSNKAAAVLLLGLLVMSACTDSVDKRSAIVTGKVTLAGSPLTAGTVLFVSDDGRAASVEVSPEGTYTAQCQPGKYKVAVSPPPPPDPLATPPGSAPPVTNQPQIPLKYQDFSKSGLSVELKDGKNEFDLALTR